MTAGTVETSGESLEAFVGTAFGDLGPSDTSPPDGEPSTPSETPVSPSAAPTEAPPAPDDASAAQPVDTPREAGETPAAPETPAEAPVDPLADATPLTYTVDGQTRTYDGIKVVGEDGAIVEPGALADLQRKLGQVEHLQGANQQLYQRVRQFEALGGEERFAKLAEEFEIVNAAGKLLLPLIAGDVNTVLGLLQRDDQGNIGWNEGARQLLLGKLQLATDKAQHDARTQFQTTRQAATAQVTQAQDVQATRQRGVQEAVAKVKEHYPAWQANDWDALQKHLTAYQDFLIRPATAEDVKQFPALTAGQMFIDYPRLGPWLVEREALRQSQQKAASTVQDATAKNTARLAAAIRPGKPSTPAKATPAQEPTRTSESADKWDLMEGLAARSIRGPAT